MFQAREKKKIQFKPSPPPMINPTLQHSFQKVFSINTTDTPSRCAVNWVHWEGALGEGETGQEAGGNRIWFVPSVTVCWGNSRGSLFFFFVMCLSGFFSNIFIGV